MRIKVAHADSADRACLVGLFHGAPGTYVITQRLVDEVEIEIVESQFFHGGAQGLLGSFVAGVLHPELGGDEEILPGHAALLQGRTHGFFVEIGGSCVDEAVAARDGVQNGLLTLPAVRDLKHPESFHGHLHAVIQHCIFHDFLSLA